MTLNRKTVLMLISLLAVLAAAAVATGCGSDKKPATGNEADAAFITDMTDHHEGAIAMARIAQTRAEHPQIRRLADGIITAQEDEITEMKHVHSQMGAMHGSGHMGMSESQMGMQMDPATLKHAKPFDREFIDAMIPHHRGAIAMAKKLEAEGSNPTLRKMAAKIIAAQSREIRQMHSWRQEWYGQRSHSMHMGG